MSGGVEPPAGPDWVLIRKDYESGAARVTALADAAGITRQKLAARARREGWRPPAGARRPRPAATRETIARLKGLLQQRLADLEAQIGSLGAEATAASSERDIRAMNTLVRTLEKVLELERKDRAARRKRRREHRALDDAEREALADRLEALHRQRTDGDVGPGGEGRQP